MDLGSSSHHSCKATDQHIIYTNAYSGGHLFRGIGSAFDRSLYLLEGDVSPPSRRSLQAEFVLKRAYHKN